MNNEKSELITRAFKLLIYNDISLYHCFKDFARDIVREMKEEDDYDHGVACYEVGEMIKNELDDEWEAEHDDDDIFWSDIVTKALYLADWAEIAAGFVEEVEEEDLYV